MCHERKFGFSFTFVSCCPVSVQKDELHLASAWSRARCCPQGPSFFKWFSEQCLENQRSDCTECCDSYSGFLPGPASVSFGCDNVQKDLKPSWGGWEGNEEERAIWPWQNPPPSRNCLPLRQALLQAHLQVAGAAVTRGHPSSVCKGELFNSVWTWTHKPGIWGKLQTTLCESWWLFVFWDPSCTDQAQIFQS